MSSPYVNFTGCPSLPFTSIVATNLPAGLNADWYTEGATNTGIFFYGTTTAAGSYTVSVSRNGTNLGSFTLNVTASIGPASLSALTVGQSVSQQFTISGGTSPYTYSVSVGALPGGLTIDSSGLVTGTANAAGTASFTLQILDGGSQTYTKAYTWTVNAAPSISTTSMPGGTAGVSYNTGLTATGGTGSLTWSLHTGSLPPGLNVTGAAIAGTPSQVGSFTFTVKATDTNNIFATQQLTINIVTSLTGMTPTSFSAGTVGQSISATFSATGGTGSPQWTVSQGSLPGGLNLAANGSLTGSLNAAGTFSFTVQVTDSSGGQYSRPFTWTVNAAPVITTTTLPNATATVAYSQQLQATGGTGSLTWSLFSGTPPAPIGLSGGGLLSGTVAAPTSGTFTVQVTDSNNISATQQLALTVSPNTVNITVTTVPAGLTVTAGAQTGPSPLTVSATVGSSLAIATVDPQSGTPGTRYVFSSWGHGGALSQSVTVPGTPATYTATFTTQYLLTTAVLPANSSTVIVSPVSQDGYYNSGTQLTLTSNANTGYQFDNWAGLPGGWNTQNPAVFNLTSAVTATANSAVLLTFQTTPAGAGYSVNNVPHTGTFTFATFPGGQVQLDAPLTQAGPSPGIRYGFQSWSDTGAASHLVTAGSTPATYTVTYVQDYLLTTSVSPQQGSIAITPVSVDGYYRTGTPVTLTVMLNPNYRFKNWNDFTGSNPRTVTMDAPKTLVAQVEAVPACDFTLNEPSASVLPSGDLNSFQVRTGPNCPWTAATDASWIVLTTLVTDTETSSGTVTYQVAVNPSTTPRTGVIRVGDRAFTVYQSGAGCTFSLNPLSVTAAATAGNFSAQVTAPTGCLWTPVAESTWVAIQGEGAQRSGPATVGFSLPANTEALPRVTAMSAGGLMLPILQRSAQMPQLFQDVPPGHPFFDYIYLTAARQITQGCMAGYFCPDAALTRAEMARIIVRALYGENFTSSPTPYFTDVPATDLDFRYIQKLREMGVTTGCGGTNYCPAATTNRGEMAVFLTRARMHIASGVTPPYNPTPYFTDVPATNSFFPFIQKVREFGITVGCSATTYCPVDTVTKAQMAAFVARGLLY